MTNAKTVRQNNYPFVLCFYLFVCALGIDFPYIYISGNFSYLDCAFLSFAAYCLLKNRFVFNLPTLCLICLAMLSGISTLSSSLEGIAIEPGKVIVALRWVAYAALFTWFASIATSTESIRRPLGWFIVGIMFLLAVAWGYWLVFPKFYWGSLPYLTTPQFNPNTLGFYLAISTPLLCYLFATSRPAQRWVWIVVTVIILMSCFFTYSKGTWLTVLAAFAVFVMFAGSVRFVLSLATFFSIFAVLGAMVVSRQNPVIDSVIARFTRSDESNSQRLAMFRTSIEMGFDRLLLGYGPKNYEYFSARYDPLAVARDPHNVYGWVFSEMGLLALVLFILVSLFWLPSRILHARCSNMRESQYFRAMVFSFTLVIMLQGFLTGMPASEKAVWILLGLFSATYFSAGGSYAKLVRKSHDPAL